MSIYPSSPYSLPVSAYTGRVAARAYLESLADTYADSVREHASCVRMWRALCAERRANAADTTCPRWRAVHARSACRAAVYIGASMRDMRRAARAYNDVRAILATIPNG
jgi:hypothetical protein